MISTTTREDQFLVLESQREALSEVRKPPGKKCYEKESTHLHKEEEKGDQEREKRGETDYQHLGDKGSSISKLRCEVERKGSSAKR